MRGWRVRMVEGEGVEGEGCEIGESGEGTCSLNC